MVKHSFAYGVFDVGRYSSGPRIHDVYVKDAATGRFVGGELRAQVLKDVFGPKKMWRLTVGHDWVVHGDYACTKIQAWDTSKLRLRARMEAGRWVDKVLEHSASTIYEDHGEGYKRYIDKGGDWKPGVSEWFDWLADIGWDRVPLDRSLLGEVEGPRSERT